MHWLSAEEVFQAFYRAAAVCLTVSFRPVDNTAVAKDTNIYSVSDGAGLPN